MTEPRYDLFCLLPLPLDLVFSYTGKLHTANVWWSTFFLPSFLPPPLLSTFNIRSFLLWL